MSVDLMILLVLTVLLSIDMFIFILQESSGYKINSKTWIRDFG